MARPGNYRPLIYAGILLGLGLGSAFEGIVFRQIFQVHSLLGRQVDPATVTGAEASLRWGGILQAVSWIIAIVGLRVLWRAGRRGDVPWRGRAFAGSFLMGWGLFICVEGMLFHHIFDLHHLVQSAPQPWRTYWDICFLAWGAIFLGVGGEILRKDRQAFLLYKKQWKETGMRPLRSINASASPNGARS